MFVPDTAGLAMSKGKWGILHSPWPYLAARIALGCIFLWAGAAKLMDPRAFARTISAYHLAPEAWLVPVAVGLPALECLAGIGLVFDIRGSLRTVAGLLVMFLVVLGYAIFNNLNVDCGCFSAEELHAQGSLRIAFYRDLGLMGIVGYLFNWRRLRKRGALECGAQA